MLWENRIRSAWEHLEDLTDEFKEQQMREDGFKINDVFGQNNAEGVDIELKELEDTSSKVTRQHRSSPSSQSPAIIANEEFVTWIKSALADNLHDGMHRMFPYPQPPVL